MGKETTRELLELKAKVMIKKIDNLYLICNMLFTNSENRQVNSLEIIKEQYLQMYNKIIETGQYEKYKYVEDIIFKEVSKIELSIDQYIYGTVQSCGKMIKENIDFIYKSKNYQDFSNLEQIIQQVETLKQVFKLYSPYLNKNEMDRLYNDINILKFNVLWRSQVEQIIYGNIQKNSLIIKCDSQEERNSFIKQLEEKMKALTSLEVESIENDEVLRVNPDTILKDNNLLERLIIIDMKKNPLNYINLVKSKIFNAHLCNIADNPFEQEVYLTEKQLSQLGFWRYHGKIGIKTNKGNYSLLRAMLKGVITDKNISIVECENLYKKFGFKCRPIVVSDGQRCIKMIYDSVKESKEYEEIIKESKKAKKCKNGEYCKIDLLGLKYNFDGLYDDENYIEDLLNQRKVNINTKRKRKFNVLKQKQKIYTKEEVLQAKKEKIKKDGSITKDIDIIISLLKDIITNDKIQISKLNEKEKITSEDRTGELDYNTKKYEKKIEEEENKIKKLEQFKSKNGQLTLDETIELLLIINYVYRQLNIKYNVWNILPLEDMDIEDGLSIFNEKNNNKIYLAPIPEQYIMLHSEMSYDFFYESTYGIEPYLDSNSEPLWRKYQNDFRNLGIDVKKCNQSYTSQKFAICVSLDDISDLPIDYEKVEILSKEKLQEIIEIEKGDER